MIEDVNMRYGRPNWPLLVVETLGTMAQYIMVALLVVISWIILRVRGGRSGLDNLSGPPRTSWLSEEWRQRAGPPSRRVSSPYSCRTPARQVRSPRLLGLLSRSECKALLTVVYRGCSDGLFGVRRPTELVTVDGIAYLIETRLSGKLGSGVGQEGAARQGPGLPSRASLVSLTYRDLAEKQSERLLCRTMQTLIRPGFFATAGTSCG